MDHPGRVTLAAGSLGPPLKEATISVTQGDETNNPRGILPWENIYNLQIKLEEILLKGN